MRRDPQAVTAALAALEREGLRRARRTIDATRDARRTTTGRSTPDDHALVCVDGRTLVDFCSNDYLGLARHPDLIAAQQRAADEWGAGARSSHLVSGHVAEHARLEEELAAFTGRERALLFSTGYMANLGVVTALADRDDVVIEDKLVHASLIDAAQLSGARLQRYAHADATAAAHVVGTALTADASRGALLATDGVFSMDGDLAPLPALAALARANGAWLLVDDAHGLGVLGATGRGVVEQFGLTSDDVPLLVGTLGKAFGSFGAFVAGDRDVIELILQRARSYIFTTALPPAVAATTRAALVVAQRESWRRERVLALTNRFREAARTAGLVLMPSPTPIQPIVLGSSERAVAASRALAEAGFWVGAIRPPTVPRGTARLRVTLNAAHREADVDALVEALVRAIGSSNPAAERS